MNVRFCAWRSNHAFRHDRIGVDVDFMTVLDNDKQISLYLSKIGALEQIKGMFLERFGQQTLH